MSIPPHSLRGDLGGCDRQFDAKLRSKTYGFMNIRRFKYLEFLLAFAILASGVFGVSEGGDPTVLIGVTSSIAGALVGVKAFEILETYRAGQQVQNQPSDGGDD